MINSSFFLNEYDSVRIYIINLKKKYIILRGKNFIFFFLFRYILLML